MIADRLQNAALYTGCRPQFQKAFDWLKTAVQSGHAETGDIQGTGGYAKKQTCVLTAEGSGSFESHRKYIDIQYIVSGREKFRFLHTDMLKTLTAYAEEKDVQRYEDHGEGAQITLEAGDFIIFFPEDGHLACISPEKEDTVSEKMIIKIPV